MADDDLPPVEEDQGDIAVSEVDTPPEPEEQPASPTVEDLASEMGWRPQDDWRGDPEKWKPAHDFMRNTVDVNHKLGTRLKGLEDQISNMARTSAKLTEQALAKQRQEILSARKEAIDLGDHEAVDQADRALREMPQIEPVNTAAPEVNDFMQRNDWFGKDADATNWARNRAGDLAKQGISEARQVLIVEREAKGLFPELFPEPKKPAKAAPLSQPGNRGGGAPAKGFSTLPKDVQAAALDYERRGVCTKEDYAKSYYEEEA